MDVSIVLNGTPPKARWLRKNIRGVVIAADGGANICSIAKVVPRYIVGDMDSVRPRVLRKLSNRAEIIRAPDQNKTDFQKSLEFAHTLGAKDILVFAALGSDIDHTLANILTLEPHIRILDERHRVFVTENKIRLKGKKGDTISIIALTRTTGLTYHGLHWKVANRSVSAGWIGIRNKLSGNVADIELRRGKVAIIHTPL